MTWDKLSTTLCWKIKDLAKVSTQFFGLTLARCRAVAPRIRSGGGRTRSFLSTRTDYPTNRLVCTCDVPIRIIREAMDTGGPAAQPVA